MSTQPTQNVPQGYKDFINGLETGKTVLNLFGRKWVTCGICKKLVLVNEMSVFMYPDAPYHTTIAAHGPCALTEKDKFDLAKQN